MNNDLSIKSYTDLNELNKLKKAGREDAPKALAAVAEQFESLFLNMILKNMRQANEGLSEGGLFDSSESKFYQDMMDQQLSVSLSSGSGIGLREVLIRQLSQGAVPQQVDAEQVIQLNRPVSQASAGLNQLLEQTAALAVQASIKQAAESVYAVDAASGATPTKPQPDRFESPEQFVQRLFPVAERVAAAAGVAPEVLVAQAALETGWGKHLPRHSDGGSSHNLFGIKADQRWSGERVSTRTLEFRDGLAQREKASFRAYGSYEQSMQDYVEFLSQGSRYQQALDQAHDPRSYTQQLQLAGYATDPDYSSKIMGILDSDLLQNAVAKMTES
ncbi:MAG: flagellar assembly peptidoglycan hydrolase FlgJ [Motiliproteus sp.]